MGAVYRAIDRETGQDVAVKRLLDVRHAARFEIEARLLASLSHPRVVKVLDHSSDEQGLYIVMDLVHGVDLGAILKRSGDPGLTLGDAIEYVRHGCEALAYVHSQQIVHRDVKPQNMILGEDGVVLVDFGVARALGAEEDQGTIAVGTPRYMAPEVFAGGTVSAACDIFCLAATLWTLLIGSPPRYGDVLKLDKLAPGLPPELQAALAGGLEMLPEQRISSARGVRRRDRRAADRRPRPLARPVPRAPDDAPQGHGGDRPHRRRHVRGRGLLDRAHRPQERRARLRGRLGRRRLRGRRHAAPAGRRHRGRGRGVRRRRVRARVPQGPALRPPGRRRAPATCPYTMVVAPLIRDGKTIGVLSVLDRRDGGPYLREDLGKVALFADLAVVALDLDTFPLSSSGGRTLLA